MKKILSILAVIILITSYVSCKKEYDSPPVKEVPFGATITIQDVKNLISDTGNLSVRTDYSIYGVITADETSGNIYKTVYFQDGTAAIPLYLQYSGGVYEGDSIRLNLKGTYLVNDNGTLAIDSVNADENIIKLATLRKVEPKIVTISQLTNPALQGYLIKLENVQFSGEYNKQTYAEPITKVSKNVTIEDCNANYIILRNSGYANFAGDTMPSGKGSFTGILGSFGGTPQLYIRNTKEVEFNGARCPGTNIIISKNFDDNSLTSGGWMVKNVEGSGVWTIGTYGGKKYANAANYINGTKIQADNWLISPAINLMGVTSPVLSFDNAWKYTGDVIQTLISTNYDGLSDPTLANWTTLNPVLSPGDFVWQNSGPINLSFYTTFNQVYIAFRYTGTPAAGSTWEIENVKIGY